MELCHERLNLPCRPLYRNEQSSFVVIFTYVLHGYNGGMHPFHFFKSLEIRYGDLDPQGHVNNARYLTYLEQARVAYLIHLNLWDGQSFTDLGMILADVHITYRAPLLFGNQIQVGVHVTRLGGKSMTMEYVIEDSQTHQELAHAATVLVAYDYRQNQTIPLPDSWRQRITEFENLPHPG